MCPAVLIDTNIILIISKNNLKKSIFCLSTSQDQAKNLQRTPSFLFFYLLSTLLLSRSKISLILESNGFKK